MYFEVVILAFQVKMLISFRCYFVEVIIMHYAFLIFKFSQNNNDIRFEILLAKIDIFCNDISVTLNESFPITSD